MIQYLIELTSYHTEELIDPNIRKCHYKYKKKERDIINKASFLRIKSMIDLFFLVVLKKIK